MKRYFTYVASVMLIVICGSIGCKKDKIAIVVSTGSISGIISPAEAVKSIFAVATAATGNTEAKFDSSNHFNIADLAPGNYKIGFVAMPGFIAPDTVAVTVSAGKNEDIGTVSFKTAATYGSVSGTISPAGAAKSIVAVPTASTGNTQAKIDSSNAFNIAGLAPGNYKIGFEAMPGFTAPDTVMVTVAAGKNVNIGTKVFTPSATYGSIIGKVSPDNAGTNISMRDSAGHVRYYGASDAAGNFKIDNVSPGSYDLSFVPSILFATPSNIKVMVIAGNTTDIGTIVLNPAGKQAIDTIATLLNLYTPADANSFIARAAGDSAIVLLASMYVGYQALTPEFMDAMNKIIIAKSIFQISGASGTLSLTGLKEVGQLSIIYSSNLTSLNLPALSSASLVLRDCPSLAHLNISALNSLSGLEIYNTGFTSLSDFQSAGLHPFELDIVGNTKLTSLTGLYFNTDNVGECTISGNTMLTSLDGLQGIKSFTSAVTIAHNPALQSLTGLENAVSAKRLTLSNNLKLNTICPAKTLLSYLKDAPTFTELQTDPRSGQTILVTVQPLDASANGNYATREDLVAAVDQCP